MKHINDTKTPKRQKNKKIKTIATMGRKRVMDLETKLPPSKALSNYEFEKRKWDAYNELRAGVSYRKAAANHSISYRCLFDYARGKKNRYESHEQYMALPIEEEQKLAQRIVQMRDESGVFPSQKVIIGMANEMIQALVNTSGEDEGAPQQQSVSDTWVSKFLKRHPALASDRKAKRQRVDTPPLSTAEQGVDSPLRQNILSTISSEAGLSTTPKTQFKRDLLQRWFVDLNKLIDKYQVSPTDIYNMALFGFQMGPGGNCRIVKRPTPGSLANLSLFECVCADGSSLDPLAVVPENQQTNGIRAAETRTGSPELATSFMWLREIFEPQTVGRSGPTNWRLLLTDASAALDLITLLWAWEHRIIILIVPKQLSRYVQPLRLGLFTRQLQEQLIFKTKQVLVQNQKQNSGIQVGIFVFLDLYLSIRLTGPFLRPTVVAAWNRAGIVPRNPNKVVDQYLAETERNGGPDVYSDDEEEQVEDEQFMYTKAGGPPSGLAGDNVDMLFGQHNRDTNLFNQETIALERQIASVDGFSSGSGPLSSSTSSAAPTSSSSAASRSKLVTHNKLMEVAQMILQSKTVPASDKPWLLYSVLNRSYELFVDGVAAAGTPGNGGAGGSQAGQVLNGYVKSGQTAVGSEHVLVSPLFRSLTEA